MALTNKEIKQRYFDKVYANAEEIECACGCGDKLKNKDRYGRDQSYINGHNGRKYDDPKQYKREWNKRNKESKDYYKVNERRARKQTLINLLGGECLKCGFAYNGKNACSFQFHHVNPATKVFPLTASKLLDVSWDEIIDEVLKCELVCANCHFQIHSSEY